jgi:hypothetical protein
MSAAKGSETRRTPRRAFVRPIGVLRKGEFGLAQGLQLSEGGFLFSCDFAMVQGNQFLVTLLLPGASSIVARAEIIYQKKDRANGVQYGARFSSLEIHQRRAIRNYVTAKTQEEAEAEAEANTGDFEDKSEMTMFQPSKRPRLPS